MASWLVRAAVEIAGCGARAVDLRRRVQPVGVRHGVRALLSGWELLFKAPATTFVVHWLRITDAVAG